MLAMIGFSTSIGPPAVLKPRYAHKLCAQFASLLITLLKSTGDGMLSVEYSFIFPVCELFWIHNSLTFIGPVGLVGRFV